MAAKKTKKVKVDPNLKYLKYSLLLLFLALVLLWASKKSGYNDPATPKTMEEVTQNNYPEIENNGDLQKAMDALDKEKVESMDTELKSFDSESAF